MKMLLKAFLPALLLGGILSCIYLLPQHDKLVESAISPEMPLGSELSGWQGERIQESERERVVLASDTKFSKAVYRKRRYSIMDAQEPWVIASIVYSGSDMNSSIHRPERCLPSQGHQNLVSSEEEIGLEDGHSIRFTRLDSIVPAQERGGKSTNHINYYVFIGHDAIRNTHMGRTMQDIYDRICRGYVQRWAYFQVGSFWGGDSDFSEQQAEEQIRSLIRVLLPRLVDWKKLEP